MLHNRRKLLLPRVTISTHGVTTTTSFLYDLLSEIEAAKEALHEQAEVSMFKLERLIAKTYGK